MAFWEKKQLPAMGSYESPHYQPEQQQGLSDSFNIGGTNNKATENFTQPEYSSPWNFCKLNNQTDEGKKGMTTNPEGGYSFFFQLA